jgi:hypothetical protein
MYRLLIPLFHSYDGQREEQARLSAALQSCGVEVVYWEEEAEGALPVADAICWQGISGYHKDMSRLERLFFQVERRAMPSVNSLALTRWNIHKGYLRDLEAKGISVLPTCWGNSRRLDMLQRQVRAQGWQEVVIKPAVSAGAYRTHRLKVEDAAAWSAVAQDIPSGVELMAQAFAPEILAEGEWSLIFFGGAFSHAVLKTAKAGDYRIQHVHGGSFKRVAPPAGVMQAAQDVLAALPEAPLYARVDGIRRGEAFLLMEVELIEPYLYTEVAPEQAALFAEAIAEQVSYRQAA